MAKSEFEYTEIGDYCILISKSTKKRELITWGNTDYSV